MIHLLFVRVYKDGVDFFTLTAREAATVVRYRATHGEIKSIDDLLKIPDVDGKNSELKRNVASQDSAPLTH